MIVKNEITRFVLQNNPLIKSHIKESDLQNIIIINHSNENHPYKQKSGYL